MPAKSKEKSPSKVISPKGVSRKVLNITAETHARLVKYAQKKGMKISAMADEMIDKALTRGGF